MFKLDVSMRPYPVTAINKCSSDWKLHFWTAQASSDSHDYYDDDDDDDDDNAREVDRIFNFLHIFYIYGYGLLYMVG